MPHPPAPWTREEDDIIRTYPVRWHALFALHQRGYDRTPNSVDQRRRQLLTLDANEGTPPPVERARHSSGAGRPRHVNAALWRLAERRPTPREYAQERARILQERTA